MEYSSGNSYTGEWCDDKQHGNGTFKWADGEEYTGEFRNDKLHGKGTYQYSNGDSYTGGFLDNKKHGRGIYILGQKASGTMASFVGQFADDYCKQGFASFRDGRVFCVIWREKAVPHMYRSEEDSILTKKKPWKTVKTISSNDIRAYILAGNPHPIVLCPECFSREPPVAAITYEWILNFDDILSYLNAAEIGKCNKKWNCSITDDMSELRIWIDILFIDQLSSDIAGNLVKAKEVYLQAPFHLMLVTAKMFSRAWCLYEMVIRYESGQGSQPLESSRMIHRAESTRHFFESMIASDERDAATISAKIVEVFGGDKKVAAARFNTIVASLFVSVCGQWS